MWMFAFLLFSASINYNFATECVYPESKLNQGEYYWREYLGEIPKDAVDGGFTEAGNRTYVGQMPSYTYIGVYPVNIIPGILGGTGSIATKTHEDNYVKILCSTRKTEFEWKTTSTDEMHLLTDYHLVIGGAQGPRVTYIGRANFIGQVQIGRVFTKEMSEKGLWLYNKTGAEVNFQTFELLALPRK